VGLNVEDSKDDMTRERVTMSDHQKKKKIEADALTKFTEFTEVKDHW
jgi:hypothetical protein